MSVYHVNVDGSEHQVHIQADGTVSVAGVPSPINVSSEHHGAYSVLINNISTHIIAKGDGQGYQVLLKHGQVQVQVETERDRLLKKYATSSVSAKQRYEVHAPMPALVAKVEVCVGDEIQKGKSLLILEAMKMENEIKSHQAGKVKEIYVKQGEAVEKAQLLMLLE